MSVSLEWPGSASDVWGSWWRGKPSFSHSHHWRLAQLPNLVCSDTNIFPSSKAGWRAFFSLCFSVFSRSQRQVVSQWCCFHCPWGCVLNWISAMTGGTGCCFWFSSLMVLLEVFNLKQLTDWPYSKIALIAALKQPLEWWTERQSRKQATRLEPLELPLLPEKNAHLSHSWSYQLPWLLAFNPSSAANVHLPTNNVSNMTSSECSGQIGSTHSKQVQSMQINDACFHSCLGISEMQLIANLSCLYLCKPHLFG